MNKQDLIQKLALVEHREGGYFAETFRSPEIIKTDRKEDDRNIIAVFKLVRYNNLGLRRVIN